MPKHYYLGFSLLELLTALSIIAIVSTYAIPSYQTYLLKARFSEIINLTNFYKNNISLALQAGYSPAEINSGTHDLPISFTPTANIANITVKKAIITAIATDKLKKVTYILTPNEDGSLWGISGTCVEAGLCSAN